jgi:hypothetical protein
MGKIIKHEFGSRNSDDVSSEQTQKEKDTLNNLLAEIDKQNKKLGEISMDEKNLLIGVLLEAELMVKFISGLSGLTQNREVLADSETYWKSCSTKDII